MWKRIVKLVIAALVALPFYGVILGIVQKKFFNGKLIKQLFEENIKGSGYSSAIRANSEKAFFNELSKLRIEYILLELSGKISHT